MDEGKLRVLFIASHPVQYSAHMFRLFAQHPRLDPLVAYCSMHNVNKGIDRDFGVEVTWDIPLLEGYQWVQVPNRARRPGVGRFFGLFNPGLWRMIREGDYDAVVVYAGYAYLSSWLVFAAAKLSGTPLVTGSDGHNVYSRRPRWWKPSLKRLMLPCVLGLADVVIVPSTPGMRWMEGLGIPSRRIVLTPYVVDNKWWTQRADQVDRGAVRRSWGVPEDAGVVLFCGKLQPWKRPQDVLRAFARAQMSGAYLAFAGDGALRSALEEEATVLGVGDQVRFLGFKNQSELPAVYRASDLLVLSSEYEPFGVVVNEAMLCGCPVAVSGQVGAGLDLVRQGETGFTFPVGDVRALAKILCETLCDRNRLRQMGEQARRRMETWSPADNVRETVNALERAAALKRRKRRTTMPT